MNKERCYFTEAARAAAAAKRREKIGQKAQARKNLEVFVVRTENAANHYIWEIRQFGAVTVQRSVDTFDGPSAARIAGEAALSAIAAPPHPNEATHSE